VERLTPAPAWLDARYPADALWRRLRAAHLDGRGVVVATLAALVAALLAAEVATGALLALYYRPDADAARASVQRVVTRVEYGELVRSLHAWGSHGLVAAVFALLGATLAAGMHRRPHEVAWVGLVVAWFASLASAFTGSLLPWTQRAALDASVAAEACARLPLVGSLLRSLAFGRPGATDLVRVYGLHVGALPALWALTAATLALHALGRVAREPTGDGPRVVPTLALRGASVAAASLGALLAVALWLPAPLGAAPAPGLPSAGDLRPSWFMAPLDALLRAAPARMLGASGATVLVTVAALGAVGALSLPLLDRAGNGVGRWLGLVVYAALLGVMGLALLR
jgi:quinol-cytochrome oxidoreductase complex cytochrome b subunit